MADGRIILQTKVDTSGIEDFFSVINKQASQLSNKYKKTFEILQNLQNKTQEITGKGDSSGKSLGDVTKIQSLSDEYIKQKNALEILVAEVEKYINSNARLSDELDIVKVRSSEVTSGFISQSTHIKTLIKSIDEIIALYQKQKEVFDSIASSKINDSQQLLSKETEQLREIQTIAQSVTAEYEKQKSLIDKVTKSNETNKNIESKKIPITKENSLPTPTTATSKSKNPDIQKLQNQYEKAILMSQKYASNLEELKAKQKGLSEGTIMPKDIVKYQQELYKLDSQYEKLSKKKELLVKQREAIPTMTYNVRNEDGSIRQEKGYLPKYQATVSSIDEKLKQLQIEIDLTEKSATNLETKLKNAMGTSVQKEIQNTSNEIALMQNKLDNAQISVASFDEKIKKTKNPVLGLGDAFDKFAKRVGNLAQRVFIFSVITKLLRALRGSIGEVILKDEQFVQSLNALKSSAWTAFSPIISNVIPILKTLVNWLNSAMIALGKFISMMTGKSYASMQKAGKAYANQTKNVKDATKAQQGLNKEMDKTLAGFDELNVLQSSDTSGTGGDVGGGASGTSSGDGSINPQEITESLFAIMSVVTGVALAIGLVLLFSGSIGAGLAVTAFGALLFFGLTETQLTEYNPEIASKLLAIVTGIGLGIAGIGLILLFVPGMHLYGIGAIVAGILAFGIAQMGLNDGSEWGIKEKLLAIAQGIGLGIATIGLIMLFLPDKFLIGIGMIIAGLAIFTYTTEELKSEGIKTIIMEKMEEVSGALILLSVVLVTIGMALLFSMVTNLMLIGLALITAGIGIFGVTEEAIGSENITTKLTQFMRECSGVLIALGTVMLVIGILLCCAQMYPLGIGLIAAGAGILLSTFYAIIDWDALGNKIKSAWEKIENWFNEKVKPIFTKKWWKQKWHNIVVAAVEGLNKLIRKINSFGFDLPDILGGGHIGFNIPEIPVPALARGAVLPPNKPFMAIVGDQKSGVNVETPLTTMIEAFNTALDNRGGGFSGNIEIPLILNSREFGRAVIKSGDLERARTTGARVGTKVVFG